MNNMDINEEDIISQLSSEEQLKLILKTAIYADGHRDNNNRLTEKSLEGFLTKAMPIWETFIKKNPNLKVNTQFIRDMGFGERMPNMVSKYKINIASLNAFNKSLDKLLQ